jgi:holo-[acyl-carrier protein] synthase
MEVLIRGPYSFAAKEAVMKAHSHRRLSFRDIEIRVQRRTTQDTFGSEGSPSGKAEQTREMGAAPSPRSSSPSPDYVTGNTSAGELLSGPPFAIILGADGSGEPPQEVQVSISHDGEYASAVCIALAPVPGSIKDKPRQ